MSEHRFTPLPIILDPSVPEGEIVFTSSPVWRGHRGPTSSWLFPQRREDGIVYYKQIDVTPGAETVVAYFCPNDPDRLDDPLETEIVAVCRAHGHYRDKGWRKEDV